MGMLIYDALVIAKAAQYLPQRGRVLTLGVPNLYFKASEFARYAAKFELGETNDFSDSASFFRGLGFSEVDALDIAPYEGANIIGDLNHRSLVERIPHRYDFIFDAGTTEHVFDFPAALSTINELLSPHGIIVHSLPANGFMDHGFWQISPDALKAFYGGAGFSILTNALFVVGAKPAALSVDDNLYRSRGRDFILRTAPEALISFAAQKGDATIEPSSLVQQYYEQMHGSSISGSAARFFLPFGSIFANRMLRTLPARLLLQLRDSFRRT